jgi:hypothetical protein
MAGMACGSDLIKNCPGARRRSVGCRILQYIEEFCCAWMRKVFVHAKQLTPRIPKLVRREPCQIEMATLSQQWQDPSASADFSSPATIMLSPCLVRTSRPTGIGKSAVTTSIRVCSGTSGVGMRTSIEPMLIQTYRCEAKGRGRRSQVETKVVRLAICLSMISTND